MPLVKLTDSCYTALEEMKKELIEKKKASGQPKKTTFSECVCKLLRDNGRLESLERDVI